nr:6014_t:CDS:2 [Entrophospora candida]
MSITVRSKTKGERVNGQIPKIDQQSIFCSNGGDSSIDDCIDGYEKTNLVTFIIMKPNLNITLHRSITGLDCYRSQNENQIITIAKFNLPDISDNDSKSVNVTSWYESNNQESEQTKSPCIFSSVTPAWNNKNLSRLAEKIKSHLVFAHVRASNSGALSETNCHPWQYESLMWMHNGHIQDFYKIKRKLVQSLKEDIFLFVQGNTDSEWAFALFLNQLSDPKNGPFSHEILRNAMLKTIQQLNIWAEEEGINEPSLLNFAVTDGCSVVCTRYINCQTREAASLYFSSEPLTFEKTDWLTIPSNTCIVVTPKLNVLLYPIKDQFYTPDKSKRKSINLLK